MSRGNRGARTPQTDQKIDVVPVEGQAPLVISPEAAAALQKEMDMHDDAFRERIEAQARMAELGNDIVSKILDLEVGQVLVAEIQEGGTLATVTYADMGALRNESVGVLDLVAAAESDITPPPASDLEPGEFVVAYIGDGGAVQQVKFETIDDLINHHKGIRQQWVEAAAEAEIEEGDDDVV